MTLRARRRTLSVAAMALAAAAAFIAPVTHAAPAAPVVRNFEFGVIGHPLQHGRDEAALKRAIAEVAQTNPAFVVATGIKAVNEPCSDKLYAQRRDLLNESSAPMIVSLAGSDWSACINSAGRSNAIERLNRLREVFYVDSESLGVRHLQVTRLSATAKFRSYAENSHWSTAKCCSRPSTCRPITTTIARKRAATASLKTVWWPTARGCTGYSRWRNGRRCMGWCCFRTATPA